MLESEAMALLVSAVLSYKNRDAALALAGSALAVLQEPKRYAAQLGGKGVAQVHRAWLEREERLGVLEEKRAIRLCLNTLRIRRICSMSGEARTLPTRFRSRSSERAARAHTA